MAGKILIDGALAALYGFNRCGTWVPPMDRLDLRVRYDAAGAPIPVRYATGTVANCMGFMADGTFPTLVWDLDAAVAA